MARTSTAHKAPDTVTPTPDQSTTIAELQRQLAEANAKLARVAPVSRTAGMVDAGDFPIGQPGVATMDSVGDAQLIQPETRPVEGPEMKSKAVALEFENELMTVHIHESSNPNLPPEPCVPVWVNGRIQIFIRGQDVTCKRMFVGALCRSKPEAFTNVEYVDESGVRRVKWPSRVAPGYPFAVIRDDNPLGRPWLKKILGEA